MIIKIENANGFTVFEKIFIMTGIIPKDIWWVGFTVYITTNNSTWIKNLSFSIIEHSEY